MSSVSELSIREDWTVVCVIRAANICGGIQIVMGFVLVATGLSTFVIPPQISLLVTPFWAGFVVMICGRFAILSPKTKSRGLIRNVRLALFLSCTVISVGVCSCACIFTYPTWMDIRQVGCVHNPDAEECVCGSAIFPELKSCQIITGHVYSLLLTNLVLCSLCISTVVSGLLLSLYAYSIYIRNVPEDATESQLLSSTVNGSGTVLSTFTPDGSLQRNGSVCGLPNGFTNNNASSGTILPCGKRHGSLRGMSNGRPCSPLHQPIMSNGFANGFANGSVNGIRLPHPQTRTCTCSCSSGLTCVGQETQI
ncbi:uncharacterized protein [Ptychodera flava]|uniref:uncharacterized protein n=1 Tax=Ptychodera flava TaxID=63121 RepID=UPI00396A06D6